MRAINADDEIGPWSLVRSFTVIVPFDSQFDGSMTNWIGIPDGQWVVDSNYLQSTRIDGNYTSAYHNSIQSDFTYQASIFKTEDTANIYDYFEFGLILRGNEPIHLSYNGFNSDYEFLINNGGYFSIWKTTNEYFLSIKPWTQTTAINKNDWNTVKVYAKGTTMIFYINNIPVYTGTGFTLPKGYVGVTMYQSADYNETLYVNWATLGKPVAGSTPTINASSGSIGESFPEFGHKGTPK